MFRQKILSLILYSCFTTLFFAQKTVYFVAIDNTFKEATDAYNNASYAHAYDLYTNIIAMKKDEEIIQISELYATLCALKLNQKGALARYKKISKFLAEKEYVKETYALAGDYFYQIEDFKNALHYYNQSTTPPTPFKYAYAAFNQHEYTQALNLFHTLNENHPNYEDAQYLMGHIYYQTQQAEEAKKIFEKLKNTSKYGSKSRNYLLQSAYQSADYETAIREGKEILAIEETTNHNLEVEKLTGESLFNQEKYTEAIPLLEQYQANTVALTTNDYYRLGYAYYQVGQYEKAISQYNNIINENSEIAQIAHYQLGHSYLKMNQKTEALQAFHSASKMNYKPTIQEDACYNYAKVSYEIGNLNGNTQAAIYSYVQQYPNGKHHAEIYNLLEKSYEGLTDYEKSYAQINTLVQNDSKLIPLQQRIALLYGAQLYKTEKYDEAYNIFEEADQQNTISANKSKILYWKAQSVYQLANYNSALQTLETLEKLNTKDAESKQLHYSKAYCYYKLNDYKSASNAFQNYLKQNPAEPYKSDAKMRLADVAYVNNELDLALQNYTTLLHHTAGDYAYYQIGMIKGLKNNYLEKATHLNQLKQLYPQSDYIDDAIYQSADASFKEKDITNAIIKFSDLIENYVDSPWYDEALFKRAQLYYTQQDKENALKDFKTLATKKNTALAQESVTNIKEIYMDMGNFEAYEDWLQQNKIQYDKEEIIRISYEQAEKKFEEKKYQEAIITFEKYLEKYPYSQKNDLAQHYLAESYYQIKNFEKAQYYFEKIATTHIEAENVNLRLAQLYVEQKKINDAQEKLLNLYKITQDAKLSAYAGAGLMRIYVDQGNYEEALLYAEAVLKNNQSNAATKDEAKLIKARAMAQNNPKESLALYAELSKSGTNAIKAEALYYNALQLHNEKKYNASNDLIFKLAADYGDEGEWTPKGLLLMSNNYISLKDKFQAISTLDALITNYPDYPEYVTSAQNQKATIK